VAAFSLGEDDKHISTVDADGVSPREYETRPSYQNRFEDDIDLRGTLTRQTSKQTFKYGLEGQRQYAVKRIVREVGSVSNPMYVPTESPENDIVMNPDAFPLINNQPAPYMGPCGSTWPQQ
jgi:hypothetical protein